MTASTRQLRIYLITFSVIVLGAVLSRSWILAGVAGAYVWGVVLLYLDGRRPPRRRTLEKWTCHTVLSEDYHLLPDGRRCAAGVRLEWGGPIRRCSLRALHSGPHWSEEAPGETWGEDNATSSGPGL